MKKKGEDFTYWYTNLFMLLAVTTLAMGIGYPLCVLFYQSLLDSSGQFVGLLNFAAYFYQFGLFHTLINTLWIGFVTVFITLAVALIFAYGVTHSHFFGKLFCYQFSLIVLFVPSIFPALGLIYLFGYQGVFNFLVGDVSFYGEMGIIIGSVIYSLPHAVFILIATLRDINQEYYQAAKTLGAGSFRCFITITLPNARYGIVSASITVFILTITDFGVPKVLGGDYSVLSIEIFKQVIGMQNFSMGAVMSIMLLTPALLAFMFDIWAKRKQKTSEYSCHQPEKFFIKDLFFTVICWTILLLPILSIFIVVIGSLMSFWPYDLTITLNNYQFSDLSYGIEPYWHSFFIALTVCLIGTIFIFIASYIMERCHISAVFKQSYKVLAMLPLSIPGTVLGLSFILAFNQYWPEFYELLDGMVILVFNCIIHFFTVCHFTLSGSLSRLNPDYEKVGATLGVAKKITFCRIILPLQINPLCDVAFYLFISALTTVSSVIFIYSADNVLASIAILQMFDSGNIAQASAMGSLILITAITMRCMISGMRSYFKYKKQKISQIGQYSNDIQVL